MAGALQMAGEIAGRSPVAVQGTKINLIYSRDHSVAEGLDYMVRARTLKIRNYWRIFLTSLHQSDHGSAFILINTLFFLSQANWNMSMLQTEDVMKSAQASMEKKSPKTIAFSKL